VHPAKTSDWLCVAALDLGANLLHGLEEVLSQDGHDDCNRGRTNGETESSPESITDGGANSCPECDSVVDAEEGTNESRIEWHVVLEYE